MTVVLGYTVLKGHRRTRMGVRWQRDDVGSRRLCCEVTRASVKIALAFSLYPQR